MSENNCSICIEPITDSQETKTTACGHTFHKECYRTWILQNTSCPICRHEGMDVDIWNWQWEHEYKDFHTCKYSASDICEALGLNTELHHSFEIFDPLTRIREDRQTIEQLANENHMIRTNRVRMAMGWDLIFKEAKWKRCHNKLRKTRMFFPYRDWTKQNGKWILLPEDYVSDDDMFSQDLFEMLY